MKRYPLWWLCVWIDLICLRGYNELLTENVFEKTILIVIGIIIWPLLARHD